MPKTAAQHSQPQLASNVANDERGDWFATTLARGLSLIEAFGPDDVWLGNADLARRTGLSKPMG